MCQDLLYNSHIYWSPDLPEYEMVFLDPAIAKVSIVRFANESVKEFIFKKFEVQHRLIRT